MMPFLYAAATVIVLFGLHRAALWAESRDWLYYRDQRPPPGAGARAANTLAALVHPEVEHVLEAENVGAEVGHDGQ